MRFFETVLSGAAIIAAALALEINDYPATGVVAGQTYTITYSPKDNTPTTFILRQGASGNLATLDTITTTATGGSFTWTVPRTLADQPDYALEIRQGETINYSGQFPLSGGSGATVSSAVASIVSSAKASASSAAASAASSASAHLSSIVASAVSSAQASATISPSAGLNSTVTSATLSTSASAASTASVSSGTSGTTSASIPESTGAASSLASSPLAAILAIAGFAYLA